MGVVIILIIRWPVNFRCPSIRNTACALVPRGDMFLLIRFLTRGAGLGEYGPETHSAGRCEGRHADPAEERQIHHRAGERVHTSRGSSAISRRHCARAHTDDAWFVRDLGSRNGTFLNDGAVETPTPLKVGDEIRVGPLHFRVEARTEKAPKSDPAAPVAPVAAAPEAPLEVDIKRGKQPPAKTVSEVVERAASKADGTTSEDDISRWLLGLEGGSGDTMRETQTLSMEETTTISRGAREDLPLPAQPAAADAAGEEEEDMVEVADETAGESRRRQGRQVGQRRLEVLQDGQESPEERRPANCRRVLPKWAKTAAKPPPTSSAK